MLTTIAACSAEMSVTIFTFQRSAAILEVRWLQKNTPSDITFEDSH